MTFTQFCGLLAIGALAGWLAARVMKRSGFGLLGYLLVGVLGSFLGRFALGLLGFSAQGHLALFLTALAGACVLLWLLSLLPGKKRRS
jgi:uncharacterized membrane protein YeaQ/YmgE (transglycosylase-associated protein family)